MVFKIGSNTVVSNSAGFVHSSFESVSYDTQSTEVKILASDGASNNQFGVAVAIGNGRIVIGANRAAGGAANTGAAYIYDLNGTQLAKITASDGVTGDLFGRSVAVNNGRIVVGAPASAGAAYIYDLNGTQLAKITASDIAALDYFGISVAIGSSRIVVGSFADDDKGDGSGSAYIFNLSGTQLAKITASDGAAYDNFGYSVSLGNGRIVVGSPYDDDNGSGSGSAYLYDLDGTFIGKIKPSDGAYGDNFGFGVAIGCGRIVVGAKFDDDNGTDSGSAYIFDLNGKQLAKIKASDGAASDYFGNEVAIGDGKIVVSAYGDDDNGSASGSAYIFDLNGTQLAKIKASDGAASDFFGHEVAIGDGKIVVSAYGDDDNGSASGSAYIFDLNGTQLAKIKASDGAASDSYSQIAINNGRIIVGATGDDDNGSTSGSAYIYKLPEDHNVHFGKILDTYSF